MKGNSDSRALICVTFSKRLGRAVLGFCLGWVWCSILSLAWLGVAAIWYGGIELALSKIKDEIWATIAFCGYFGAAAGSWVASTVAPFSLGGCRLRWPIRTSSFLGGIVGGIIGTLAGVLIGWHADSGADGSKSAAELAINLGIFGGAVMGVVIGRWLTHSLSKSSFPRERVAGMTGAE